MTRHAAALASALFLAVASTSTLAQQTPPPTYETAIANTWKNLHNKLLDMAKDLPEGKLSWKPHADSRTMAEEFRHVTIGLEMTSAMLEGKPFNYNERVKADVGKPVTRASIVAEMEAAIATSNALVAKSPSPRLIGWVDHQGEHYGKLVSNYRMIGIVPPVSRPKQ
jgi:hypothetical protein